MLNQCHDAGLYIAYGCNGHRYIQDPFHMTHNKIAGNMKATSLYPKPSDEIITEWEQRTNEVYTLYLHSIDIVLPKDITKDKVEDKVKDKVKDKALGIPQDAFEQIWISYPRKKGKERARKSFKAQVKTEQDWADINTALDNYIAEIKRRGIEEQYIKMGSTWFNEYWRDDVDYKPIETAKTLSLADVIILNRTVKWMGSIGSRKSVKELEEMVTGAIDRRGGSMVARALEKMNNIPKPGLKAFWEYLKQ